MQIGFDEFARYTTIALKQFLSAAAQNDQINLTNKAVNHDINVLRPVMEMGVGIGWGSYLSCQDWYLDLSVRYDFLQLWNQNVMRIYAIGMNGVSTPTDNLQMHGITATARFDF